MAKGRTPPSNRTLASFTALIAQLELTHVWLQAAQIENLLDGTLPEQAHGFDIDIASGWSPWEEGFDARIDYTVTLNGGDDLGPPDEIAEINVTFGLRYLSSVEMTDPLFELFSADTLLLNSWPYAREFVASTVGRFGWMPLVLPVYRPGQGFSTMTPGTGSEADDVFDREANEMINALLADVPGPRARRKPGRNRPR